MSQNDLKKYIELLEIKVSKMFEKEGSGHDIYHLKRVFNLALTLQEKEGGDRMVIGVSSFLHDIHRVISNKNRKFCSPKESLPIITKLLKSVDFPKEKIPKVLHCIEFHEEYGFTKAGKTVSDIETLILQDADNLDAIGAIGIGRTFSFCGSHNLPMWEPKIPFRKDFEGEHKYDVSCLHHFHSKLLLLKDNMNTKTAKKIAKERDGFMQQFLLRFIKEWDGKI